MPFGPLGKCLNLGKLTSSDSSNGSFVDPFSRAFHRAGFHALQADKGVYFTLTHKGYLENNQRR